MIYGHLSVPGALWITGDRPSESATAKPARELRQEHRVALASSTGLPFCSQAWLEAAQQPERTQERKGKEERETRWLKYSVTGGGLGGVRAQPRGLLATGGRLRDLADGFHSGWGWLATRRLDSLLDLLGPLHVVRSRLLTRQALDEVLQAPPEACHLEGVVEPACSRHSQGAK